jgi:hypothetical protein
MTPYLNSLKDALGFWRDVSEERDVNTSLQGYTRCPSGWTGEDGQAVEVLVGVDVNGSKYVAVHPQRRLQSGRNKGTWGTGGRGDFHTREEFQYFYESVTRAGREAGFLPD